MYGTIVHIGESDLEVASVLIGDILEHVDRLFPHSSSDKLGEPVQTQWNSRQGNYHVRTNVQLTYFGLSCSLKRAIRQKKKTSVTPARQASSIRHPVFSVATSHVEVAPSGQLREGTIARARIEVTIAPREKLYNSLSIGSRSTPTGDLRLSSCDEPKCSQYR